ncbi:hypothetical protein LBMAG53_27120 [Planctomycetota bacterium]|nr:hypothetical protein LBMAG53_27120 [Planctomycetota bacterium]
MHLTTVCLGEDPGGDNPAVRLTVAHAVSHLAEMSDASDSDDALVLAAQGGDLAAWSALCHRHSPMLAAYLGGRLGRPDVVDRLLGQAIVTGWRNLRDPTVADDFAAWWRRLGGHLATTWHQEHPDEPLTGPFPTERCADPGRKLAFDRLEHALTKLEETDRRFLELSIRGGLGEPGAGSILGSAGDGAQNGILSRLEEVLGEIP